MEDRIVEFIAGLRAAGVRVSLAESADAFRAVDQVGIADRDLFKATLQATLVKDSADVPHFEKLFPIYFGSGGPPTRDPNQDLSQNEMDALKDSLRDLVGDDARLKQLMRYLLEGDNPTREELDELGNQAGVPMARNPSQQPWLT